MAVLLFWLLLAAWFYVMFSWLASAQVPPRIEPRIVTNYISAIAHDKFGNWSDFANEDSTTNRSFTVTFDPSPSAGESNIITYSIFVGRKSRVYTREYFIGTNCAMRFPIPVTNVVTAFCGGVEFFSVTNPAGNLFMRSRGINATWTSIESSTNLRDWTLFRFASGPRTDLTISNK